MQERSAVVAAVTGHPVVGREYLGSHRAGLYFSHQQQFLAVRPWGRLLDFSGPHCLYLGNGHNKTYLPAVDAG